MMSDNSQRRGPFSAMARVLTALAGFIVAVTGLIAVIPTIQGWLDEGGGNPAESPAPRAVLDVKTDKGRFSFSKVQVGQNSAEPIKVFLRNIGKGPATVVPKLEGDHAGDFEIVFQNCAEGPVGIEAACEVWLNFLPTSVGKKNVRLTLQPPVEGFRTQNFEGEGIALGSVAFLPPRATFQILTSASPVPVNAKEQVYIYNSGQGKLKISSVTTNEPSRFTVSTNCNGQEVQPAKYCAVTVTFATKTDGNYPALLTVADDAPNSPHTVQLVGYRGRYTFAIKPNDVFKVLPLLSPPPSRRP
jgi:hypothetical protein